MDAAECQMLLFPILVMTLLDYFNSTLTSDNDKSIQYSASRMRVMNHNSEVMTY